MTAVDTQTLVSSDTTPDIASGVTKDKEDTRVVPNNTTSDKVDTSSAKSGIFTFFRKGEGKRPRAGGLTSTKKPTTDPKPKTKNTSSSTKTQSTSTKTDSSSKKKK